MKLTKGSTMLTVLSLGAGVQSTTLALMAAHGENAARRAYQDVRRIEIREVKK